MSDVYDLPEPASLTIDDLLARLREHNAVIRELGDQYADGEIPEYGLSNQQLFVRLGGSDELQQGGLRGIETLENARDSDDKTLVWVPREDSARFGGEG